MQCKSHLQVVHLRVGCLHRSLACSGVGSTDAVTLSVTTISTSTVYSNTLTLLNTDLLLTSGIMSVGAAHSINMKCLVQSNSMFLLIVLVGMVFVLIQCCEYVHLY